MAEGGSTADQIPWQEKLATAREYKKLGNERFKTGNSAQAIGKYHRALLYLKGIDHNKTTLQALGAAFGGAKTADGSQDIPAEAKKEVEELQIDCYNNLAVVFLKMSSPKYDKVVTYSDRALELSPVSMKALFRKGAALYHLNDIDDAIECLTKASKLPGGDKDVTIKKYLQLCKVASVSQDEKLKNTYKGMFAKMAKEDNEQGETKQHTESETIEQHTTNNINSKHAELQTGS